MAWDLESCLKKPPLEAWFKPKRGLIIWSCTSFCGGNGDRVGGITSTFALALCLGADFKMRWTHPVNHNLLFTYPSIAFTRAPSFHYIDKKIPTEKDWKGLIQTHGSIQIFTNARYAHPQHVRWRIFNMLLRPKPPITNLFPRLPSCNVCVHIREGDSVMGVGKARTENATRLLNLAHNYNRHNISSRICVFTDSMILKQKLHEDNRYALSPFKPVHSDRTKNASLANIAESWAEIFAMSTCTVIVKSRSGFSNIAVDLANMSLVEPNVFTSKKSKFKFSV